MAISAAEISAFENDGYVVARALFSPEESGAMIDHYMQLRRTGAYPYDMVADKAVAGDPLLKFPRMIHMHRWDELTRRWLLDDRIAQYLTGLMGVEPFAAQSMIYFKPPGARGQALHQDQYYLNVKPGTCIAAWMALDRADEQNGCMKVVPGSHRWPLLCVEKADVSSSFTNQTVRVPNSKPAVPIVMNAGDVLFFNGHVVHGSSPNSTVDRFRRALIGHFVPSTAVELTDFDQPVLAMDGRELKLDAAPFGGPCGNWVERNDQPVLELSGVNSPAGLSHE